MLFQLISSVSSPLKNTAIRNILQLPAQLAEFKRLKESFPPFAKPKKGHHKTVVSKVQILLPCQQNIESSVSLAH